MARMVATKASLSIRVDALADVDTKSEPMAPTIGIENRAKLESRLRALEYRSDLSGVRNADPNAARRQQPKFQMTGETKTYNTAADAVGLTSLAGRDPQEAAVQAVLDVKEERKKRKEEKKLAKEERKKEKRQVVERAHAAEDAMDEDGKEKENGTVGETKEEKKARKAARRAAKKGAAAPEGEAESAPLAITESVDSLAISGSAVPSITSGDDSSKASKKKRPRDGESPDKKLKKKKTAA